MITVADFSVLHTQLWSLCKEDPLGFIIVHPELIMLKKIKSYRDKSVLKNVYHTELTKTIKNVYISYKNTFNCNFLIVINNKWNIYIHSSGQTNQEKHINISTVCIIYIIV